MSSSGREPKKVDESLLRRVASLPPGGQKWLKTALQTIATLEPAEVHEQATEQAPAAGGEAPRRARGADLEEVLSGAADAREQVEAYPELAEELEGIADIVDLLREAGRERRRLGEEILRESESEPPQEDEADEEDETG